MLYSVNLSYFFNVRYFKMSLSRKGWKLTQNWKFSKYTISWQMLKFTNVSLTFLHSLLQFQRYIMFKFYLKNQVKITECNFRDYICHRTVSVRKLYSAGSVLVKYQDKRVFVENQSVCILCGFFAIRLPICHWFNLCRMTLTGTRMTLTGTIDQSNDESWLFWLTHF